MASSRPLVKLLGAPEVVLGESAVDFDTRKALGILAYLVVERTASRETLAGLFWTDSPPDRARATLRRTLSSLRSGIGPKAIRADRNNVELGEVESDFASFLECLEKSAGHGHPEREVCSACIAPLSRASELYRDHFLRGFVIKRAPYFEEWERATADDLGRRMADVLDRLATAHAADGEFGKAILAVARWIDLDPLHEPAHRKRMLLSAWAGDRPGAIDAYRDFVSILDRELAVAPLEETTELYEAILDEDLPPAPGQRSRVVAVPGPEPTDGTLLDREVELARLHAALDESRRSGRFICVTGAAWMGKTTLLDELVNVAKDHLRLTSRAHRAESGLPFGVVAQLLEPLDPELIRDELPEWVRGELARIMPAFGPTSSATRDPFGQLRLLEALRLLMKKQAERQPLLVVIDDLHWIDPASASFLSFLSARISGLPILILAAQRTGGGLSTELMELVSNAEQLRLDPLTAEDLPQDVDDAEVVIRATSGIPLLVAERLAGKEESGAVERYVSTHLDRISKLGHQVLGAASVLGAAGTYPLLRNVSGRTDDELVAALDELTVGRWLREVPQGAGYVFTIEAASEMTYESLSLARRRLLHQRAAEAITEQTRAESEVRLATLVATHFHKAGDERSADWYRTAGDLARASFANSEAMTLYEFALALATDDTTDLQIAIAELAMADGDYDRALHSLNLASARAVDGQRGRVDHLIGEVHRTMGRFDPATHYFERAVKRHPEPAQVYADWALLAHRVGDESLAVELGERALAAAKETDDPAAQSRVYNVNGVIAGSDDLALTHLDRAVELADGDEVALMAALNNKARVLTERGEIHESVELVERAIDLAAKTGHRHREAALRDFLADLQHRSGHRELARQTQTEAMALFADVDTGSLEPELWLLRRW